MSWVALATPLHRYHHNAAAAWIRQVAPLLWFPSRNCLRWFAVMRANVCVRANKPISTTCVYLISLCEWQTYIHAHITTIYIHVYVCVRKYIYSYFIYVNIVRPCNHMVSRICCLTLLLLFLHLLCGKFLWFPVVCLFCHFRCHIEISTSIWCCQQSTQTHTYTITQIHLQCCGCLFAFHITRCWRCSICWISISVCIYVYVCAMLVAWRWQPTVACALYVHIYFAAWLIHIQTINSCICICINVCMCVYSWRFKVVFEYPKGKENTFPQFWAELVKIIRWMLFEN